MGAELLKFLTRQHQLTLAQVASMAVPIIGGPEGKLLRVFPGDNVSPSLYPYKCYRNINYKYISPSFLCITPAVTGIWEAATVVQL